MPSDSTQNCSSERGLCSWAHPEPEGHLPQQEDTPKGILHSWPKIWGWEGHGRPGPGEGRRDSTAFSLVEAILEERLGLGLAPQAAAPEPGPGKALSLPSFILSSLYLGLGIPAML